MNDKPVVKKCPRCGKLYKLGYTGIVGQCDQCAGVERDEKDYVWMPGESEQTQYDISTGEMFRVQRPETRKTWEAKR